jgi:hypothetical protein
MTRNLATDGTDLKQVQQKCENRLTGWDVSAFLKKETAHGNRKHQGCYVTIRRRANALSKLKVSITFCLFLTTINCNQGLWARTLMI